MLRSPTNVAGVFGRSFAAHTPEAKAQARAVLNQIGMFPLSEDQPGRGPSTARPARATRCFRPGLTAEMVAADPDMLRVRPVDVDRPSGTTSKKVLDANPIVGADDAAMAEQARTLIALREVRPAWQALLDHVALEADAELHDSARYHQVGVDAGNGWQRQENGGAWGTDWFGRAQAAVIYIYVNDYHEAIYFIRGTDAEGALLYGRYRYTMTFPKDALPPVDRAARRLLVADDVRPGLLHAGRQPQRPHTTSAPSISTPTNWGSHADGSLTLHLSHATARRTRPRRPTGCRRRTVSSRSSCAPTCRRSRCSTARTSCRTCSGCKTTQ